MALFAEWCLDFFNLEGHLCAGFKTAPGVEICLSGVAYETAIES